MTSVPSRGWDAHLPDLVSLGIHIRLDPPPQRLPIGREIEAVDARRNGVRRESEEQLVTIPLGAEAE